MMTTMNDDSLVNLVHEATGMPRNMVVAILAFAVVGVFATGIFLSWGITALLNEPLHSFRKDPAQAASAEVDSDWTKKGTWPWAIDMVERLDKSCSIAHQRIESQRVRINELEKRIDWLENRIKEIK